MQIRCEKCIKKLCAIDLDTGNITYQAEGIHYWEKDEKIYIQCPKCHTDKILVPKPKETDIVLASKK